MQRKIKFVIVNLTLVIVLIMLLMPIVSLAQGDQGLIPCGTITNTEPCEFKHFMILINTVIDFIFKYLAMPIAAIMFVYAGGLLVITGGSPENRTKAKSIFTSTLIGLVLAAAAWIIVRTLLLIMEYKFVDTFFKQ